MRSQRMVDVEPRCVLRSGWPICWCCRRPARSRSVVVGVAAVGFVEDLADDGGGVVGDAGGQPLTACAGSSPSGVGCRTTTTTTPASCGGPWWTPKSHIRSRPTRTTPTTRPATSRRSPTHRRTSPRTCSVSAMTVSDVSPTPGRRTVVPGRDGRLFWRPHGGWVSWSRSVLSLLHLRRDRQPTHRDPTRRDRRYRPHLCLSRCCWITATHAHLGHLRHAARHHSGHVRVRRSR